MRPAMSRFSIMSTMCSEWRIVAVRAVRAELHLGLETLGGRRAVHELHLLPLLLGYQHLARLAALEGPHDAQLLHLIDQPRRGEAGATSVSGTISTTPLDQRWYTQFRIGRWENGESVVNEGSQFPNDPESLDQFFRQMTPDTGMRSDMGADFDSDVVARAVAATIDEVYARTGKDSILVTHSQGGLPGWTAAQYTDHIAAIIAIEPGGAPAADSAEFQTLAEKNIPITMYFGDYIDNGDPALAATMAWQAMRQTCYDFETAYNEQGGNCTVVDLPEEGITGNDHFMFQDLNNDVIAQHIENWIEETLA